MSLADESEVYKAGYLKGHEAGYALGVKVGMRAVVGWLERVKKIKVPKYQLKEWGL